jgi:hypothetical protein
MGTKADLIKQLYPNINWARFEAIDTVLNFELWWGTVNEYYPSAEDWPDGYVYPGLDKCMQDMIDILAPLPHEMWFDCDGESIVTEDNPEDYEPYWTYKCEYCGEWLNTDGKVWVDHTDGDCCSGNDDGENENQVHIPDYNTAEWCGGEWEKFNVRKALMFDETYKQVF